MTTGLEHPEALASERDGGYSCGARQHSVTYGKKNCEMYTFKGAIDK